MFEFNLSIFTNIIMIVFYVFTACVAGSGLFIWKKQFKAKIEYNLAHKILTSVYKYRDAISFIRRQAVAFTLSPEDIKYNLSKEDRIFNFKCDYYQNNLQQIDEYRVILYANIFESEIHWKRDLRLIVDKLAGVEHKIRIHFIDYLDFSSPDFGYGAYDDRIIDIRKKLFITPGIEDEFSKEITSVIKEIEEFLKPKLKL